MPKINALGVPSYDGRQGHVTNAVGEQFEVNPSLDVNGEPVDGYTNEPVGDFEATPAPGTEGPVVLVDDAYTDDTEPDEQPDGNETPAFEPKPRNARKR